MRDARLTHRICKPGRSAALRCGGLALAATIGAVCADAPAGARLKSVAAVAPASAGQPALAVGFDSSGVLRAAVCQRKPCRPTGGENLDLPPEAQLLATRARLSVVRLGQGRHAVHVNIPDPERQRSWEAVVFARPGGSKPTVLFRGWTGLVQGEYGLRRGPMVMISDAAQDGSRRIVLGEQREDLTLCGRPAVLSPKLLLASDLKLHPAKVQRLSAADRSAATQVTAKRLPDKATRAEHPVLRAVAASSAVGDPKALTDGDPNTTWAENRGRDGRGEFVLMQAPPELPIEAFEVVIRPPEAEPEHGVSPKKFFIVTSRAIFAVQLPEDAWVHPGARYEVQLTQPVRTDCVALVTESAYRVTKNARVTFAELRARTAFASSSLPQLVAALAGGSERAEAAAAALRSLGPAAFAAVAQAYDSLDEGGRRLALDVIDHAPCATSVPVYVRALLSRYEAHRIHATVRLRRCGASNVDVLVEAVKKAPAKQRAVIADQLALAAPARAVEVIVAMLGKASAERRRELRVVLGRASDSSRARRAVLLALDDRSLGKVAAIDLLRALGRSITRFRPAAARAFGRLATAKASFRTRYLLLEPAAALCSADPSALSYLRRALATDRNPHIRAQAARVVRNPTALQNELLRALIDPGVRVREAALRTLATRRGSFAGRVIVGRLQGDAWPLVRAAAADALAEHGPSPQHDRALFEALEDSSRHVRAPVLRALGKRRARAYAPPIRERLQDRDEHSSVRIAAATALGRMCDHESVDVLTDYALLLADPVGAGEARVIAPAALRALSRLSPPDLAKRLSPLLSKEAPTVARYAAQDAVSRRGSCGRRSRTR